MKIRASQINGCAYCLVMHTTMRASLARAMSGCICSMPGARRRCSPSANARRWPGSRRVTLVAEGHVPDDVYEEARRHFSEKELVDLTAATVAINGWNRIAIAFRATPQVKSAKVAA